MDLLHMYYIFEDNIGYYDSKKFIKFSKLKNTP